MEKRLKTNPLQWAIFLDFAEANPVILTRKFDSVNGKQKYDELWKEIAATLNSMGYLQKTVLKWQKAVADWKSKVKGKAGDIKKDLTKTGGGGPLPTLNDNEKRLMAIIGWSVTGTDTVELGFDSETTGVLDQCSISTSVKLNDEICDIFSPPPLIYPEASSSNVKTDTWLSMPSKAVLSLTAASSPSPSKSPLKRKVLSATQHKKNNLTNTSSSTPQSRFKDNIATRNMQQMHNETLSVLKEINSNLGKMADTQDKLCSLLEKLITKYEGTEPVIVK